MDNEAFNVVNVSASGMPMVPERSLDVASLQHVDFSREVQSRPLWKFRLTESSKHSMRAISTTVLQISSMVDENP